MSKEDERAPDSVPESRDARQDLHEVAECVRSLLAVSPEPASLGRLYRMYKELERHIREIENDSRGSDYCI